MIATIHKVDMSIVESGQQQFALRINDSGLGPMPCIHFSRAAHGHNAIPNHSQRLRLRPGFVYSPDFCVGDDEISGGLGLG
jgi:hypothetical protein